MICYMCQCIGHHPDGCLVGRAEKAEAKVAALEARLSDMAADRDETRDRCAEVTGRLVALTAQLAEVGAVVEAVAAWQLTAEGSDEEDLAMLNVGRAYNALRAARAKHEKGGAA